VQKLQNVLANVFLQIPRVLINQTII